MSEGYSHLLNHRRILHGAQCLYKEIMDGFYTPEECSKMAVEALLLTPEEVANPTPKNREKLIQLALTTPEGQQKCKDAIDMVVTDDIKAILDFIGSFQCSKCNKDSGVYDDKIKVIDSRAKYNLDIITKKLLEG